MNIIKSFTFIVLAYNHASYILEHLESIKYLVVNHGEGIVIDIVVADDASRDNTVGLTELWVAKNAYLFRKVAILSDGINRGTCKNLTHALEILDTDYCKITAGDDVYSYENIFLEIKQIDEKHILSGFPLNLINGKIVETRFELFNLFATNAIYEEWDYLERLKRINFFNSPSVVYATSALLNEDVISFVNRYSVTEDYPLQIKMAEIYKPLKFVQVEKIFVYYRRTGNSTYLVKSTEFSRDKVAIFNYLIQLESNTWKRLLLRNRLYCYNLQNRYLKRILNLNLYLYGLDVLRNIFLISRRIKKFDANIDSHQSHYDAIVLTARNYRV